MLTQAQSDVADHLTIIFPNHSRDTIEKTVLHLDNLEEALDQGLLLQRGIDLLLDRNVAEKISSSIPQDVGPSTFEQPGDVVVHARTGLNDTPGTKTGQTSGLMSSTRGPVYGESKRSEAVDTGLSRLSVDSGDVIVTRMEPGEVVVTGTVGPKDVFIMEETSNLQPSWRNSSPRSHIDTSGKGVKLDQGSSLNTSNIRRENNCVADTMNPVIEKTGNVATTTSISNVSVSCSKVLSDTSAPTYVSSGSTTQRSTSCTHCPWIDDELPEISAKLKTFAALGIKVDSNLRERFKITDNKDSGGDDDLPDILPPTHKIAVSDTNNNNNSMYNHRNSVVKDIRTSAVEQEKNTDKNTLNRQKTDSVRNKILETTSVIPTVSRTNAAPLQSNVHSPTVVRNSQPVGGKTGSGLLESSHSPGAKKQPTPYKVDLTRRTLAQREMSASPSHTKVTMYGTSNIDMLGKNLYSVPGKSLSFTGTNTQSKPNLKHLSSDPIPGTKSTLFGSNLSGFHGNINYRADLPPMPFHSTIPSATVTSNSPASHHRVTMYETPTKATPNIDVQGRNVNFSLSQPVTQTDRTEEAKQPTNVKNKQQNQGKLNNLSVPASSTVITPSQGAGIPKPATVTIQSQHVITYSSNAAKPTVVIPDTQTVVVPSEPAVVLSAPEVTVHTTNKNSGQVASEQLEAEIVEGDEPDIILTLEKTAEEQRKQVISDVLNLFPDVDRQFLQDLAVQHMGPYAVNNICNVLLESQYPRSMPKQTPTATVTAMTDSTETSSVDYYTDFVSIKLPTPLEEHKYRNQVFAQLTCDFRWIPVPTIRKVMSHFCNHYAPTYKVLRENWMEFVKSQPDGQQVRYSWKEVKVKFDVGGQSCELKFKLLKNPRPAASPGSNVHPLLQKELAFISKRDEELSREADYKIAMELNEQMYEEMGQMIECGCCYGEYPFEGMIQCYDGHLFCQTCLHQYAKESVFGQGKVSLTCMTDECTSTFPKSQLIRALPESVLDKYEDRLQEESLNLADLGDLVRCPHCDFAAILDPGDKVFTCQATSCMRETCRYCKEDWKEHFGKKCEEIEKKDETKLRLEYEEKMTKAKVRTCHRCKAEFMKEDGCNKMTCRCGAKMCYICRKPNINYDHFCRHPRDPGKKCTTCTDCSLWTNADEDDDRAVAEIQKAAEDARKEQGYTDEKLIGAPSQPPAKKQKTK